MIDYARTHPPSPVGEAGMPEAEETKRCHEGKNVSPHKSAKLDVTATGGTSIVLDDSNVREPEAKVPKNSKDKSLIVFTSSFCPSLCWQNSRCHGGWRALTQMSRRDWMQHLAWRRSRDSWR